MPLEVGTHINQLVSSNPTATDQKSQGDDHLRMIKGALVTDFPNIGGVVTATQGQLNFTTANRTNWPTAGSVALVVGQLAWRGPGANHTVFDASGSLDPAGNACNPSNSAIAWAATYPALMGYNGTTTYGLRVDTARYAENALGATQTWQDMLASRALTTVYSNTSGKTVFVAVGVAANASSNVSAQVNSVTVWLEGAGTTGRNMQVAIAVPSGGNYAITASGSLAYWSELR